MNYPGWSIPAAHGNTPSCRRSTERIPAQTSRAGAAIPAVPTFPKGFPSPIFPLLSPSPCTRPPSLGFPASRGLTGVFSRRAGLLHSRHGLGDRRLSRFNLQDKHPGAGACSVLSPGTRRSSTRLRALPTPPGVPPHLRAREVPQLCSRAGLELGGRKSPPREPLGGFLRNGSSWSFHGPDGCGKGWKMSIKTPNVTLSAAQGADPVKNQAVCLQKSPFYGLSF